MTRTRHLMVLFFTFSVALTSLGCVPNLHRRRGHSAHSGGHGNGRGHGPPAHSNAGGNGRGHVRGHDDDHDNGHGSMGHR